MRLVVNGVEYEGSPEPRTSLADFLRHELGLTGTKVGCEHGVCGACTVQVDGEPVRSCLMLAVQARGREVRTIEGLGDHPLKPAFQEAHALQCGFCTAGVLMSLDAFLREHPSPGEEEIREALAGTLCRCTGYLGMIEAVGRAASAARPDDAPTGSSSTT
jgi:aerobic-type carbon monoxide dehydrogenase small subunit (CoxS/CutS family)